MIPRIAFLKTVERFHFGSLPNLAAPRPAHLTLKGTTLTEKEEGERVCSCVRGFRVVVVGESDGFFKTCQSLRIINDAVYFKRNWEASI